MAVGTAGPNGRHRGTESFRDMHTIHLRAMGETPMTFPDAEIPLFRLDYSNEQAWNDVVLAALGEASERTDPLTIVDDAEFAGMDIDELLARLNEDDPGYRFFVVADTRTLTEADHPFTIVTATNPPHRFPAAAHTVSDVVANLWISNLDIEDYLAAVDPDGIYRATPPPAHRTAGTHDPGRGDLRGDGRGPVAGIARGVPSRSDRLPRPGRDFACSPTLSISDSSPSTGPRIPSRGT
jgi:hypothetical protein